MSLKTMLSNLKLSKGKEVLNLSLFQESDIFSLRMRKCYFSPVSIQSILHPTVFSLYASILFDFFKSSINLVLQLFIALVKGGL